MRYYFPYWNFTSCIRTDSRNAIRSAIINLLGQEQGYLFLPNFPYLMLNNETVNTNYFYRQHLVNPYERPPLLIIGLGIGREGWTIIKTYPNDWLFIRTPDGKRPRLSALAMELQCDAFHYRVTNNSESLLLETNSVGEYKIQCAKNQKFSLIDVSESLHKAMQIEKYNVSVPSLDGIEADECEKIDFFLMKALDPFQYYWQVYDLFKQSYFNFKKLDEMNIKLLHFYPPNNYLKSLPVYREDIEDYWHEAQFLNDTEML